MGLYVLGILLKTTWSDITCLVNLTLSNLLRSLKKANLTIWNKNIETQDFKKFKYFKNFNKKLLRIIKVKKRINK